jgi:DNA-3-methyladenine glycosylase I
MAETTTSAPRPPVTDQPVTAAPRPDVVAGDDGRARCGWAAGDPLYTAYHDDEWGRPLRDETALFGLLCLEAFQSGLSWITILRKRPAFLAAFDGFDPAAVAGYGEPDVARLMADTGIVRNRAKVDAVVANARALVAMHDSGETLVDLLFSFAPAEGSAERPAGRFTSLAEVPSATPSSTAMAKALRARGFRFVGPVVAYALMQSAGVVDDHLAGCWVGG